MASLAPCPCLSPTLSWASVFACVQRRGAFDPWTSFRASQKCTGKSVNTQDWGSQGTEFPKWGGILRRRAGRLVWARAAMWTVGEARVCKASLGVLGPACLHRSGSLLLNGCGCWVDELGLRPADERELRQALEQKSEVLKAPAQSGSLDTQRGVEAGRPRRKGPA